MSADKQNLSDSDTDRRDMKHDGTCVPIISSPLRGRGAAVPPGDPQIRNFGLKFSQFDREYLENGKSQRYMSIRAEHQLDESFLQV